MSQKDVLKKVVAKSKNAELIRFCLRAVETQYQKPLAAYAFIPMLIKQWGLTTNAQISEALQIDTMASLCLTYRRLIADGYIKVTEATTKGTPYIYSLTSKAEKLKFISDPEVFDWFCNFYIHFENGRRGPVRHYLTLKAVTIALLAQARDGITVDEMQDVMSDNWGDTQYARELMMRKGMLHREDMPDTRRKLYTLDPEFALC